MEYPRITIGGKIYSLRVAKGMTQEQLAAMLCVSPAAVSKWERNLANPSIEMLWALADYFDVQIDYLLGKNDDARSVREGKKYNQIIIQAVDKYRQLHGYDKQEIELLLDWKDMYADLEKNRILGDEGMLRSIQNIFEVMDSPEGSIPIAELIKNFSPDKIELTEGEKLLLDLFRSVPEDQQQMVLQMIRVALGKQ